MRDKIVLDVLRKECIRVIVIWECTVKKMMSDNVIAEECLSKITTFMNNEEPQNMEL